MVFPALLRNRTVTGAFLFLALLLLSPPTHPRDREVLFREDFTNLENWKPVYFQKIDQHTSYTIAFEPWGSFLKAESRASASAIMLKRSFHVYEYSKVSWRWKAENVYEKGDAKSKSGDDYPIRVYVMFKFDPEKATFAERVKYEVAKMLHGEYPPHSTLNYIWANREHPKRAITSTYTEKSKMIPLQMGGKNLGTWQVEEIDIMDDYRMAFGTDPPAVASIAIMNDSDNTGEGSVSCIDYIEIYRYHSTK